MYIHLTTITVKSTKRKGGWEVGMGVRMSWGSEQAGSGAEKHTLTSTVDSHYIVPKIKFDKSNNKSMLFRNTEVRPKSIS